MCARALVVGCLAVIVAGAVALPAAAGTPVTLQAASPTAACPNQDTDVTGADVTLAGEAAICVINAVRAEYSLAPLSETSQLDAQAQTEAADPNQTPPSPPTGDTFGEFAVQADQNAYTLVSDEMKSAGGCSEILNPWFSQIGVSVSDVPPAPTLTEGEIYSAAPEWAVIMEGPLTTTTPPNFAPAQSCPHALPVDAAGQGGPNAGATGPPVSIVVASVSRRTVRLSLNCPVVDGSRCALTLRLTLEHGGANATSRTVTPRFRTFSNLPSLDLADVSVTVNAAALKRAQAAHPAYLAVAVHQTAPASATFTLYIPLPR